MEMGTGKTKTYIDFAGCAERKWGAERALVLTSKTVAEGVWPLELKKHLPDEVKLKWRILNYESIIDREYYDEDTDTYYETDNFSKILRWVERKPTVLICDEVYGWRKPTTKTARAVHQLGEAAVACVVGTGTPISKWHLDLFSIFKAINPGILGTSWSAFKREFALWGGWGGHKMLKPIKRKRLVRRIKPYSFRIRKEQCLDLPPSTHEIVQVELDEAQPVYDEMAGESIVEIAGDDIEAPIVLTRMLRLSQITGGFLKGEESNHRVGQEKYTALKGLLEDLRLADRPRVVIFCRFKEDIRRASIAAKKCGYQPILFHGQTKRRDLAIARFEESEEPVAFVAQIRAGALGIDLTAASEAIFYSHTYSWEEFSQACARLHRDSEKWKRNRHGEFIHEGGPANRVTYYHLICKDTVDEAVWLSLKTKRHLAKTVVDHPELVFREDD